MRIAKKRAVWFAALVCGIGMGGTTTPISAAAPTTGLTITPATLTLELAKGAQQTTAAFTLTNNYEANLPLHFSFAPSKNNVAGVTNTNPAAQLTAAQADLILPPHSSATQTVTLTDSSRLAPGSQFVDLIITQVTPAQQKLYANAAIHMPLVVIKDEGAVSGLLASGFSTNGIHTHTPTSLGVTIKNTGNVVAIPHGSIVITDHSGKEVGKGVLNTASQALAPGASLYFSTPIVSITSASLLGSYHAALHYGLGGDQTAGSAQTSFIYIGWHHIVATLCIVGVVALGYTALRLMKLIKKPPAGNHPNIQKRAS